MNKKTYWVIAGFISFRYYNKLSEQNYYHLLESVAQNLDQINFISNDTELKDVADLAAKNNLNVGIAIYLPFYIKSGKQNEIDLIVQYCKDSHRPVILYDISGEFHAETADKILGKEIRGCRPMVCASALWLEKDPITGCVADGREKTEQSLRRMVLFNLGSTKKFIEQRLSEEKFKTR